MESEALVELDGGQQNLGAEGKNQEPAGTLR